MPKPSECETTRTSIFRYSREMGWPHVFRVKVEQRRIFLLLVLLCIPICSGAAFCAEVCHIDNQPVLLYKIINWWYDCLPAECDLFCGKTVKCANEGNTRIEYDEERMALKLRTDGRFAELLSLSEKCDRCFELRCAWKNEKYLRNAEAVAVSGWDGVEFRNIGKDQARMISDMKENLAFVVEGKIRGLRDDGKIALYPAGNFSMNCPKIKDADSPITLVIPNVKTNEILAKYVVVPAKK